MQDFTKLTVWKRAHEVALEVYSATKSFPREERWGLTAQLRRSAVSVPSNVAEGSGRRSAADFARFLSIAVGSASELEYQLLVARDLGYLTHDDWRTLSRLTVEVRRMLIKLHDAVRAG